MKTWGKLVITGLVLAVVAIGCGQKAQNSSEAIEASKAKATVEAQVQYLVQQANGFINSKQFDEAINTAKYILANLDKESAQAKSVLEKAEAELKKLAEQKMQEVKDKLGGFGQ